MTIPRWLFVRLPRRWQWWLITRSLKRMNRALFDLADEGHAAADAVAVFVVQAPSLQLAGIAWPDPVWTPVSVPAPNVAIKPPPSDAID